VYNILFTLASITCVTHQPISVKFCVRKQFFHRTSVMGQKSAFHRTFSQRSLGSGERRLSYRLRYTCLMLNILETVPDTDSFNRVLIGTYIGSLYSRVYIPNDLE